MATTPTYLRQIAMLVPMSSHPPPLQTEYCELAKTSTRKFGPAPEVTKLEAYLVSDKNLRDAFVDNLTDN
jgi:hypothetical protein